MKWFLGVSLGLCWLLVACAGETPAIIDTIPTKPPVQVLPGGTSIIVPPTLSPAEKTALPAGSLIQLTLDNQSDWNVCYVFISPPSEDSWGDDRLGTEEVIEISQRRVFEIQPGIYDMRAENCDYIGLEEQYEVDLSRSTRWEVNNPAVLDIESFIEKGAWKTSGSGAQGSISDESYVLHTSQPDVLALASWGKKFDNLVMTVEATPLVSNGLAPAGYGVMCRAQPNGDGYLFLISDDGLYAIFRNDHNERIPMVNWKASEDVLTGTQLNVIEARCDGESLALRINGKTVEELTDASYRNGDVGLVVLPGSTGNAQVQFDNLVLTEP